MARTTTRYKVGELVFYAGSLWRRHGFMHVIAINTTQCPPTYTLHDPIWGGILRQVSETSLHH